MNGRMEHQLKSEASVQKRLLNYPKYLTDYYFILLANDREYTTINSYFNYIINFLEFEKNRDVDIENPNNFTSSELATYLSSKRYIMTKHGRRETTGSYRSSIHITLNHLFNYLHNEGKMTIKPLANIERPSKLNDKSPEQYMTKEEMQAVINAVKTGVGTDLSKARQKLWMTRDLCIMLLLITTGLRNTALTEINVDSFTEDFDKLTYVDKGGKTVEKNISENIRPYIIQWFNDRLELVDYDYTIDALFISNRRTRISQNTVACLVKKYTAILEKNISPHRVRASFATNLYIQTKNISLVQNAMNHRNSSTTETYIKAFGASEKEVADIAGNFVTV